MNLECISRKCIKPSSPTPPNLQIFNMSLLDQLSPNIHGNITFFYPHKTSAQEFSAKSQLLQDSLSQILTLFYPLAARLRDAATIHCNDQGAFFIQSRTQTPLSQILSPPNFDIIQNLLPTTHSDSLLLVRFTLFGCGATAITISLTHKIADFAALITLLKAWTAACIGGDTQPVVPELAIGSALFPPREILPAGISGSVNIAAEKFTTRRLIFESSKVEELKKRVKSELQFEASRVEVVLGLIWRCALLTTSKRKTPSTLFQAVNLRRRMEPPIPETALGNLVWAFAVTVEEECEVELQVVVKKMRDSLKEFMERKGERLNNSEGRCEVVMEDLKERGEMLKKSGNVVYKCSSWCKVGSSLYEVDFGWGKPLWMCSVNNIVSNTVALMDTRDGHGVEAFVTLDHQHMDSFQQSQELLHYALLNPPLL
ncbi:stemmadenine O-acetyltransferase-like [Arachis hypogaea]|uniref:stemmadenine O-acetyltransferase-like n=1 Tax=Arachis hypogaea TaxID=3818 RepID=UPI000DED95BD|nr:vinorine synthase-like [Arachis hypogaea]